MLEDSPVTQQSPVSFVSKHEAGQRIDNYLLSKLKSLPKSRIYKMVRKGEVRVNSKRISVHYKLNIGDKLRLPPFVNRLLAEQSSDKVQLPYNLKATIQSSILYEDESLIVLNKPSGLAVHGGSGISLGLIEACREIWTENGFLELVHRLDRDTSGCIMLAKTRKKLVELHDQLKAGKIQKFYLALVQGQWQGGRKVLAPLKKHTLRSGERMVKVQADGQACETHFSIRQTFTDHTLLQAKPITGRTHQIRVHAAFMGHPIIGDPKYGDKHVNQAAKLQKFNRLFLHAEQLVLPMGKEFLTIRSELPSDCQKYLNQLQIERKDE